MARSDPQVNFRIPLNLKDILEASARNSGRTLTAEIVWRLEASFSASGQDPADPEIQMLDRRLQELEALQARWNGLNEEGKQLDVAEEEAMKEADRLKRAPQLAAIRARIIACAESALRLDTQIQRVRADIDALTDSIKGRAHQLHEAHQLQGERKLKR